MRILKLIVRLFLRSCLFMFAVPLILFFVPIFTLGLLGEMLWAWADDDDYAVDVAWSSLKELYSLAFVDWWKEL